MWRIVWTGDDAKPPINPNPVWYMASDADICKGIVSVNITSRLQAANELAAQMKKEPARIFQGHSGTVLSIVQDLDKYTTFTGISFMAFEQTGRRENDIYRDAAKGFRKMSEDECLTWSGLIVAPWRVEKFGKMMIVQSHLNI